MSKKENDQKKISQKEAMINEVTVQLSASLQNLKTELGEKKFEKRTRKAAKLLVEGIKFNTPGKPAAKKSPTKKSPIKKVAKPAPVKKNAAKPAPAKKNAIPKK
ncbi:MAG: hypothetical protein ABIN67_08970 [Ferruginibacter sp.]